ncbi:hypothetical protein ACSBR1_001294 [Camellia fascicularis]
MVLDWAVGNQTYAEARKNLTSFACKDKSDYEDFDNGPGYPCKCSTGYEGTLIFLMVVKVTTTTVSNFTFSS